MEWFELGWLVLLVLWPFLIKLMRSKRSRRSSSSDEKAATEAERASGEVSDKVRDFLGELRDALGSALELPDLEEEAPPSGVPGEEREELLPHVFEERAERGTERVIASIPPVAARQRRQHSPLVATLLSDLKEPRALSRAVVIREVLGPPVALRQGDGR